MPQRLRIATFNLESLDERPDLDPPFTARMAVLRPQLMRLDADVLCLQEVNGQHPPGGGPRRLLALDRLLDETPYAAFERLASGQISGAGAHAPPGQRGVDAVHNLVILSRYPIASSAELRHELVAPPVYRKTTARPSARKAEAIEWDRPILHAALMLPDGRKLHVVNLHLRAPLAAPVAGQKQDSLTWKSVSGWAEGFFLATVKRAGQALETRLLIDLLFDAEPEALIAVCGDFNAEERQTPSGPSAATRKTLEIRSLIRARSCRWSAHYPNPSASRYSTASTRRCSITSWFRRHYSSVTGGSRSTTRTWPTS